MTLILDGRKIDCELRKNSLVLAYDDAYYLKLFNDCTDKREVSLSTLWEEKDFFHYEIVIDEIVKLGDRMEVFFRKMFPLWMVK